MTTFYGRIPSASSAILHSQKTSNSRGSLGIFTKTHANLDTQGFQRIHDFLLQDQSAKLLPKERVRFCLKNRIDKNKRRDVKYNEDRKKAHWSNVQRCGSLWTCPVCAKQISEKRREELKAGIEKWKSHHNGGVLLLTLTFSHSASHALKTLLDCQKKALKRFYEHRTAVTLFKSIGLKYKIKALEVTYGQNGWHPHNHVLLLIEKVLSIAEFSKIKNDLSELWIKACVRSGLNAPSMQYGLDLRDGSYAEKYVGKWGLEHELSKGHVKKGRNGGLTPFDLLQFSIEDEERFFKKPSKLFQEFGIAIKGARQLEWGRGLKKFLQIEEKTDQDLAEETEKNAITLTQVDDFIFALLCTYQKRHEFLRCLEQDYEDGCFGCGTAEHLLIKILQLEDMRLNAVA